MNQNFKRFFSITALLFSAIASADNNDGSCSTCPTTCAKGQNLIQPHAFSVSSSREIMLEKAAWDPMKDEEGWHGTFGVGFNYQRSFSRKCTTDNTGCCNDLGSLPFWAANGTNTMTIGGNDTGNDLDAYQLGLGPVTTTGTVALNPLVYQTGADFLFYFGSHKTERGFFVKAHAPVGVISINPRLAYTDTITAVDYQLGALNSGAAAGTIEAPYENISQAFAGGESAGFLKAMNRGLISCARTSAAKFGDAEFALGYNVYADECKHLGIAVRFSAPTGNKAEGVYVFEPVFGRNGHWAAGGEIIGHWKFWESDTDNKYAQVFFDGTALHLFNSKHIRSFDLAANGAGSKYMLLAKYSDLVTGAAFQNEIINAVNITTLGVKSTFAVEGNFALGFDFHWNNWSFELGYEGWGRSCEKLSIDCACGTATNFNQYAVLGRQTPFATNGTTVLDLAQPLATIGASTDHKNTVGEDAANGILDATAGANRIPADAATALDIDGQRARAVYSSKPYAELRYTWTDCDYVPYLAVTGGAELPHIHKNEALKVWNIGVNGGIAF
jgi:hypothetical protein